MCYPASCGDIPGKNVPEHIEAIAVPVDNKIIDHKAIYIGCDKAAQRIFRRAYDWFTLYIERCIQ